MITWLIESCSLLFAELTQMETPRLVLRSFLTFSRHKLLRMLLCFIDAEHALALRAHFGGENRCTLWFDVRSNSGTLQAAVVLVAL